MIRNDICQTCSHYYVCKNLSTLEKFDSESKKYIGVDIEMIACRDYNYEFPTNGKIEVKSNDADNSEEDEE